MNVNLGRKVNIWSSRNVSWGVYNKGPVKLEFVDDNCPRWCCSFWVGSWGITFHWYCKKRAEAIDA